MKRTAILPVFACLVLSAAARAERFETVDLRTVEGNLAVLTADKAVLSDGGKQQTLPLADVESIALRDVEDLNARAGQAVVQTVAGDWLTADKISAADGKMKFTSPMIGEVELPMTTVSILYTPGANQTVGAAVKRAAEVRPPDKPTDMIVVDQGKEWVGVEGVLVAVKDQKLTFRMGEEDRQIEARYVKAIRLATPAATSRPVAGRLFCADGSELLFSAIELVEGAFVVSAPAAGTVKVPRKNVAAIHFTSGRLALLSALAPAEVVEHGLFDTKFPHRKDRCVSGGPLKLGGRTYTTGLGLNSYTQLTYKIDGQYKSFVAIVGIDDSIRPQGNATLTVLGDGKELGKPLTLTGKNAPQELRVDVSGVKGLVIRVDFGPDKLPVGDHVDLCSARLVK